MTRALKLGAKQSISTPNKKHRTAIDAANNPYIKTKDTICIQQILAANKARLSFDSTIEASFQSPVTEEVPDSLKPYQHQDTEQDFIYKLGRQLNVGDWYGIELNLRKLKRYLGVFGKATVASIVNRKFVNHIEQEKERKLFRSQHNQAETLLSHAIRNKGTENVISLLVGLGADLYRETSDIRKEEMQDFFATLTLEAAPYAVTMKNDASYLGLAMTYNRPDVIKILAKAGIDIHKKDASGNNLLHSYVKSLHVHIEVIDALLELGVDKNALNDAGQSPLNLFLRSIRTPEEIKLLLKKGLKAFIEKDAGDQDSSNATVEITKDTIIEFLDLKPDRLSVLSAAKFFLKTGDILITSKLLEITDTARKQLDTNTDYLTDFLPQILFDYPPGLLNNFAYMFESKAFSSKTPLGEEILLAALNHPKDPKLENEAAQFITAAITSISRFMMHDLKATGRKVSNWKQFGLNTFSHGFFKHDCRRRKYIDPDTGKINFGPSLVQEYGMQLVINR
ncbi:MAG: hypothetical protein KDD56_10680, partial [Bdellovibrionales bacterium]|nr:hypothetical protein [Bdellovibrionales bacterium]